MASFFSSNFNTNFKVNSFEILTLNQFAGQKTYRKHTENIVEINTALYRIDD